MTNNSSWLPRTLTGQRDLIRVSTSYSKATNYAEFTDSYTGDRSLIQNVFTKVRMVKVQGSSVGHRSAKACEGGEGLINRKRGVGVQWPVDEAGARKGGYNSTNNPNLLGSIHPNTHEKIKNQKLVATSRQNEGSGEFMFCFKKL